MIRHGEGLLPANHGDGARNGPHRRGRGGDLTRQPRVVDGGLREGDQAFEHLTRPDAVDHLLRESHRLELECHDRLVGATIVHEVLEAVHEIVGGLVDTEPEGRLGQEQAPHRDSEGRGEERQDRARRVAEHDRVSSGGPDHGGEILDLALRRRAAHVAARAAGAAVPGHAAEAGIRQRVSESAGVRRERHRAADHDDQ